ncbi:MAG: ArsR/SmtB family transcription factor [Bacillota bacterium]
MNIRFGYYPILDMLLAIRQLYSVERFKPFNDLTAAVEAKLTPEERSFIIEIGDETRGWLHVLERAIELTLKGISSPEEFIIFSKEHPAIFFDTPKEHGIMRKAAESVKSLWQNYFGSETAKSSKAVFDRVMELSNEVNALGLYDYLLSLTDRVMKVDDKTIRVLIKPEHNIEFDKLQNVLVMPSLFASRKFTFWNNGYDHLFYISMDSCSKEVAEPSDMLLLKTLALNDKTRLKLLRHLTKGNYSTADMAESFNMNSSTISRHFKLFKDAGFVDIFSQEGNSVYYSLNLEEIKKSMDMIINYIRGEEI